MNMYKPQRAFYKTNKTRIDNLFNKHIKLVELFVFKYNNLFLNDLDETRQVLLEILLNTCISWYKNKTYLKNYVKKDSKNVGIMSNIELKVYNKTHTNVTSTKVDFEYSYGRRVKTDMQNVITKNKKEITYELSELDTSFNIKNVDESIDNNTFDVEEFIY